MSLMSQLQAELSEAVGTDPNDLDIDWDAPGVLLSVGDGEPWERYVTTGRRDNRGQPLLVAADCLADERDQWLVPVDGIELRHGPLTAA